MPDLIINSQVINFPNSSASPDWSEAIIQFANAVASALQGVVGTFDVPNQTFNIDSYNPTPSATSLPSLAFSTTNVRAAFIYYSVYRTTSTSTAYESGMIITVYNQNGTPGSLWELNKEHVGDGQTTFSITDTGQVQFTTAALSGLNHTGTISYFAKALLK